MIKVNTAKAQTITESQKWAEINRQIAALTVTTTAGNKFAANDVAMGYIARKRDAMEGTDTIMWYEDWASFEVTKIELEEAYILADKAQQTIFDTIMEAIQ